jgi:peptide/nickel transport system substrate-binding protein
VPPLNNVHCRMAVEYAYSKVDYQTAYGGGGNGQIATTASPVLIDHKNFDL